jgi:hypothetical protein
MQTSTSRELETASSEPTRHFRGEQVYLGSGCTNDLSSEIRRVRTPFPSYGIRIGEVRIFSPTPAMIYIETCIAAFGPDRGMFESNFRP